jgi:hypothetical protein
MMDAATTPSGSRTAVSMGRVGKGLSKVLDKEASTRPAEPSGGGRGGARGGERGHASHDSSNARRYSC